MGARGTLPQDPPRSGGRQRGLTAGSLLSPRWCSPRLKKAPQLERGRSPDTDLPGATRVWARPARSRPDPLAARRPGASRARSSSSRCWLPQPREARASVTGTVVNIVRAGITPPTVECDTAGISTRHPIGSGRSLRCRVAITMPAGCTRCKASARDPLARSTARNRPVAPPPCPSETSRHGTRGARRRWPRGLDLQSAQGAVPRARAYQARSSALLPRGLGGSAEGRGGAA